LWLTDYVGVKVADVNYSLAVKMGEPKKRLKLSLTLTVVSIAYASMIGATPLFRRIEKEMAPILDTLRNEAKVTFLEELYL